MTDQEYQEPVQQGAPAPQDKPPVDPPVGVGDAAGGVHTDYSEDPFADKRNAQDQLSPSDGTTPDPLADQAQAEAHGVAVPPEEPQDAPAAE